MSWTINLKNIVLFIPLPRWLDSQKKRLDDVRKQNYKVFLYKGYFSPLNYKFIININTMKHIKVVLLSLLSSYWSHLSALMSGYV